MAGKGPFALQVQRASEHQAQVNSWSQSQAKRAFDLACAVPMTLVALPIMLVVATAVRVTSAGPVLFRQKRCGKDGQEFELLKFRSMRHCATLKGPGVTCATDARITPVGRILRNWKLDELPQLFNVLLGHMSMVGPRPDLPEYMAEADSQSREVLRFPPGITGCATLQYRHEEELLATVPVEQLRAFYIRELLPRKARCDLEYAQRATLWDDVRVLLLTVKAIWA